MKEKISCGIVSITNDKRIILILKKYTYEFMCLILGFYKNGLKLNNITEMEREILLKFSIKEIYNTYFNDNKMRFSRIRKNFKEYKRKISIKSGKSFNEYLKKLKLNNNLMWEIPKGRIRYKEKFYNCAKREFVEETGINNIFINNNITPMKEIKIRRNTKYITYYYLGECEYIKVEEPDAREILIVSSFYIDEIDHLNMEESKKNIIKKLYQIHEDMRNCN
jgi:ADP-ribose pyrophosphatase YjhB (NUDIX family)